MKRLLVCCFALTLLAAAAFRWMPAPAPLSLPEPTTATSPAPPEPPAEKVTLRTNANAVEVFRRAFWREPAADDRIVHAERREWVNDQDGVRRWQWFLAVQPSLGFSTWLRDTNPFNLAKAQRASFSFAQSSPEWFPATADLAPHDILQAADGGMTLIFDQKSQMLYATDSGHGFAAVPKQSASRPPAPAHSATTELRDWQPLR